MNNPVDYKKYNITSTSQFDTALSELKSNGLTAEIQKLFRVISEVIQGVDMYEVEYARPLKNTEKMQHIHLDGRKTGDILLIYKVDGHNIDLDLRLYNITDHKNLDRVSNPRFVKRQALHEFDVIANKYSQVQIDFARDCYLDLIADPEFHRYKGDKKTQYSQEYLKLYFETSTCEESLTFDEFLEIIQYLEHQYNRSIFGAVNFSTPQITSPITSREEKYILNLIQDYGVIIYDAYIETEVDEYDDTYECMYVDVGSDDRESIKLLESELYSLESLFQISFDRRPNGLGRFGRTYQFYHYFE